MAEFNDKLKNSNGNEEEKTRIIFNLSVNNDNNNKDNSNCKQSNTQTGGDTEEAYFDANEGVNDEKSLFSCSSSFTFSPFSSLDSVTSSSNETNSTNLLLSRAESQTGQEATLLIHLSQEDQIQRDLVTDEQLARVRREIEEMESQTNAQNALSVELNRRKSRKDLVKVPIESSLPVALHANETGKEEEPTATFDETAPIDDSTGTSTGISTGTGALRQSEGLRIVDEDHRNYILMYDMLTGIRISVSRCQAKPARPLTSQDFRASHKMAFDLTGNEETPSSRYDFKFKDYAPWVFRSLREQFLIDAADYLVSLTGKYVLSELYSPGKSGSLFYYSQDNRFIIKTIRESEHLFLRKILSRYHQHIQDQPNTLIVRFFGLHRVQLPKGKKIYFVVMSNLFPNDRVMRSIYDLKGSTHGRWHPEESDQIGNNDDLMVGLNRKGPGPVVLKDLNWLGKREKLVLGPIKATQLMNQLKIDCRFLAKLNIMDYSLLIGLHTLHTLPTLHTNSNDNTYNSDPYMFYRDFKGFQASFEDNSNGPEVYYLGIIDILTPYSMIKKMEHTFKSLIFPKDSISAVNPASYARRFLKFMSENILQNVEADYSRRLLPKIPTVTEANEETKDGGVDGVDDDESEFVNINNLE